MSQSNETADFIAYAITHNGRPFFRTQARVMGFDIPADMEAILVAKFPASEGYTIIRDVVPNSIRTSTLAN